MPETHEQLQERFERFCKCGHPKWYHEYPRPDLGSIQMWICAHSDKSHEIKPENDVCKCDGYSPIGPIDLCELIERAKEKALDI